MIAAKIYIWTERGGTGGGHGEGERIKREVGNCNEPRPAQAAQSRLSKPLFYSYARGAVPP